MNELTLFRTVHFPGLFNQTVFTDFCVVTKFARNITIDDVVLLYILSKYGVLQVPSIVSRFILEVS